MSAPDVGLVFGALADASRRHVLRTLSSRPNATQQELSAELPITRQAVSKHLATLRAAGLVEFERRGRETHYRLTPEPLEAHPRPELGQSVLLVTETDGPAKFWSPTKWASLADGVAALWI